MSLKNEPRKGALGSIRGIATIIGPGLFSATFALFIGTLAYLHVPGAPWFVAALLLFVAILVAYGATRREPETFDLPSAAPVLAE